MSRISRRVAASPLAPVAALPVRVREVARRDGQLIRNSARWLLTSREHTNYTFTLEPLNLVHLAWWVSTVADIPVAQARGFIDEAAGDEQLARHVLEATATSSRRRLADPEVRLGKRLGWYALVRAFRPEHVVETGTDKGLGSVVFAAALLANGSGRLTTIDINEDAGYLIGGRYGDVVDRRFGSSVDVLRGLDRSVDFFIHDSLHTREYESAELQAVTPLLRAGASVLSDNAHVTDVLPSWAETTGRRYYYWQEQPRDHWYPGGGIGLARF